MIRDFLGFLGRSALAAGLTVAEQRLKTFAEDAERQKRIDAAIPTREVSPGVFIPDLET